MFKLSFAIAALLATLPPTVFADEIEVYSENATLLRSPLSDCRNCVDQSGRVNEVGFHLLAGRRDIGHILMPATDRSKRGKLGGKRIYYMWGNLERAYVAASMSAARESIWEFQASGFDVVVDCATSLEEAKSYFDDPLMYGFFWASHGSSSFTGRGFLTTNEGDRCKCVNGDCGAGAVKIGPLGDKKGTGLCYSDLRTISLEERQTPVVFGLICGCGAPDFIQSPNPDEPPLADKLLTKPGCVRAVRNEDYGYPALPRGQVYAKACLPAPRALFWNHYAWARKNGCDGNRPNVVVEPTPTPPQAPVPNQPQAPILTPPQTTKAVPIGGGTVTRQYIYTLPPGGIAPAPQYSYPPQAPQYNYIPPASQYSPPQPVYPQPQYYAPPTTIYRGSRPSQVFHGQPSDVVW